jgi:gamma-glutamyltranspeptidase/glutathione hydrolase
MALNILKGYDLKALGHNSADYIHVVTEALKLAFSDRHNHFGDPKFVKVPMKGLMSDRYAAYRRTLISAEKAWAVMPPAGDPANFTEIANRWMPAPQPDDAPGPGDTSYVCAVDRHGNAFSCTPSDGSNKTPIVPGVGILCSGRGTQSWADPTHPSSVAPGKRPRLTPSPAMAFQRARAHAVRHAGRRRAGAGHAPGVSQHQRLRHGAAGCDRGAALRQLQLSRFV